MAMWIRSLNILRRAVSISIPLKVLRDRGWEHEKYLVIDDRIPEILVIRRLPGEKSGDNESPKRAADADRSSGGAG